MITIHPITFKLRYFISTQPTTRLSSDDTINRIIRIESWFNNSDLVYGVDYKWADRKYTVVNKISDTTFSEGVFFNNEEDATAFKLTIGL